jgi:hypothetical protein
MAMPRLPGDRQPPRRHLPCDVVPRSPGGCRPRGPVRFTQIAAVAPVTLYALDADGRIWRREGLWEWTLIPPPDPEARVEAAIERLGPG